MKETQRTLTAVQLVTPERREAIWGQSGQVACLFQVDDETNVFTTLVEGRDLQIVDEKVVVASLRARQALEKCLKLDTAAVNREYKTEPLDGVEEVTTSYLQL